MSHVFTSVLHRSILAGSVAVCCTASLFAQADPASRVARLNYLSGSVSMKPAEANDWFGAELNRPFSSGDSLYTDIDGRAELHTDVAAIRLGARTNFTFTALSDQAMRIQINDGDMYFRVHNLGSSDAIEIDTPNAAVNVLRDGVYRLRVDSNGGISFIVVRQGTAEVNAGGQAVTVNPGNSLLVSGGGNPTYDLGQAPAEDDFDMWCHERDDHEMRLASMRYVPPTLIGYEDLDANGYWLATAQYGPVWYPQTVPAGWAPYRFGHWVWISPWGWTWVDDASWGFAPFHYGRWVYVNSRWGWSPGPIVVVANAPRPRPRYAPALVAWVGGSHWGVGVAVGTPTAWVVLGFGELYTPPYHCSPGYFNNVNVNNTRVVNTVNITNVYQTVYVNKTVYNQTYVHMNSPNAVVAVPASAMASGQPVHQQAIALNQSQIQQLQPVAAPPVARPSQFAVRARMAAQPPAAPQHAARFAQANQPPVARPNNAAFSPQPQTRPAYAPPVAAPQNAASKPPTQYPHATQKAPAPQAKAPKPEKEHKPNK